MAATALTSDVPALRARAVDPIEALRAEEMCSAGVTVPGTTLCCRPAATPGDLRGSTPVRRDVRCAGYDRTSQTADD
jgi:hypothetical protein